MHRALRARVDARRMVHLALAARDALRARARVDGPEDHVHLLERAALRLRDEHREDGHAADVDGSEHEEDLPAEVLDHLRGELGHNEVCARMFSMEIAENWGEGGRTEEPLGRGRGRETVMARARREDIRAVHPRQRSPAQRVEAHIDKQHRGHRLARGRRVRALDERARRERLEERGDDVEEDAHAERGDEQRELAPERLDEAEDEDGGRNDFDDAVHAGREQRVLRAGVPNLRAAVSASGGTCRGRGRTEVKIWGA